MPASKPMMIIVHLVGVARLDADCFSLWNAERHQPGVDGSSTAEIE
jgi:hypothetical protein